MKNMSKKGMHIIEHYEVVLYEKEGDEGEAISFVYEDGKCGMNHYYWGGEEDYERNRDGVVEANYIWDEENTQKLMLRTGTHNGKDLLKAMYERFVEKESSADLYVLGFCDKHGIKYDKQVWY